MVIGNKWSLVRDNNLWSTEVLRISVAYFVGASILPPCSPNKRFDHALKFGRNYAKV